MSLKQQVRILFLVRPVLLIGVCAVFLGITGPVILADPPPTFTAAEIQQYIGVNEGDRVRFTGICTVESAVYGFSLTVACDPGGGEWSGIAIYDGYDQRLNADRSEWVDVVGIVEEYYDKTEINCTNEYEYPPLALNEFGSLPFPVSTTTGAMSTAESMESCIIILYDVEVMSDPDPYGDISIDDGSGIGTVLFKVVEPVPPVGTVFDCLRGNLDYHFGEFKIRPRDLNDRLCPPTSTPDPSATPCIHDGDANQDGSVTAGDAQLAFYMVLGLYIPSFEEACAADCNGDEEITSGDAQQIFMKALGTGACIDDL
ncbi:MAG TPA: dockerin type I repeat-containing protein [bacterium]|nr:dockerin type I repeat-containing protein [bacterium]